jgi:hypothetical protein
MRRHLGTVAVLGTLFLGTASLAAGCSGKASSGSPGVAATASGAPGSTAAGAPPAPAGAVTTSSVDPSAAAAADAALSGNTKAICAQAARTSTTFGETFIADLRLQIDAATQGAQPKAQAEQKIDQDVESYSSALADMARLTTDPALKKALTEMSKQVTALKGDISKFNADRMSALTATLDKACGKS